MRVITPRTVDSPAIGTGILACGVYFIFMDCDDTFTQNFAGTSSSHDGHECSGDPNVFCYVCANYIGKKNTKRITDRLVILYEKCFDMKVSLHLKNWIPNFVCGSCYNMINRFEKHQDKDKLKFKTPTIWRKPLDSSDCYFCMTDIGGVKQIHKNKIAYASVTSIQRPVMRLIEGLGDNESRDSLASESDTMQVDVDPENVNPMEEEESDTSASDERSASESDEIEQEESSGSGKEYVPVGKDRMPQKYDQKHLNDLFRKAKLSKEVAELMASDMKKRNLLTKGTKASFYRNREAAFRKYFEKDGDLLYCTDVKGVIDELKPNLYKPEEWRLFIDSSQQSLKAVLLHNTNKFASLPLGHSTVLKEEYSNLEILLEKIKYEEHKWQVCGDLKILSMILGQQSGFTKYPYYLCMFDSRDRKNHYKQKVWPSRPSFKIGSHNIIRKPLVDPSKILIPPLHIKLGLMKQFVKALDKEGECFAYLRTVFGHKSDAKLREGIFDGPEIRKLFKDADFVSTMKDQEKASWLSFKEVCTKFLGNTKDADYRNIVATMIQNFQNLGCLMNLKLHFLDSHLDQFPENNGDFSEEQGERFHQDLKEFERRFQGQWGVNMFADYCWMLQRETNKKGKKRSRNPLHRSFEDKRVRKRQSL